MNEPIMRRGLSPEGRLIRQKHQGSLLNDEFGVTSLPVHKKIEKDFLKENVLRLKEIQAKCRTQEARPISGSQPVKAIRPSNIELSYKDITYDGIATEEKGTKSNGRDGSAHSDYFSLPDDASNERDQNLRPICSQNRIIRSPCHERYCAKAPSIVSLDQFNGSVKTSVKNNTNYMNVLMARNNEIVDCKKTDLTNIKTFPPKFKECFPQSPSLRRNKINNIIEKIKSKPPACETNMENIWKDIRKEHRTLFLTDECLSFATPRTPHLAGLKNAIPNASKDSGYNKKSTSLARSRSLDRRTMRPKSVMVQNFGSVHTLNPRPQSTTPTKLINLEPEFKELPPQLLNKYEFPDTVYQTESLPNLSGMLDERNGNLRNDPYFIVKSQVPCSTAAILYDSTYPDESSFKSNVSLNGSCLVNQKTRTSTVVSDSIYTVNDEQFARDSVNKSPCDENPIPTTSTTVHDSPYTETGNELSRIADYGPSTSVEGDSTFIINDILHPNRKDSAGDEQQLHSSSAYVGDSGVYKKDMLLKKENISAKSEHSDNRPSNELIAVDRSSSDPNLDTIETGRIIAPILTKKHHQTKCQQSNQPKVGNNSLLRSKSTNNLHLAGEPPPTYKRGQLPKYLKNRKTEAQRRLEALAAIDPLCPPGHSPVPDPERKNTLHLLKKAQTDVISQLSSLPVAQDTLRVRKLRSDLETKLSQIEEGISIFSQPKVYVLNEDE